MPTFGDRVRKRRIALGLSQKQLARLVKFSHQSAISAIENNRHKGTPRITELAEALQTTPEHLLHGKSDKVTKLESRSPVATYGGELTATERQLLAAFRALTTGQQQSKIAEIEAMAQQNKELLRELGQNKSNGTNG